jgi:phosphatidylglycerophosphate synthase
MFVPLVVLVLLQQNFCALIIHIVASVLDFVDGALARARGECSDLGATMDAMADKVYFAGAVGLLLPLMDYSQSPWWLTGSLFLTGFFLVGIEAQLARVRWQDHVYNQGHPGGGRDPRSKNPGKLKFVFEIIGVGALVATYPEIEYLPSPWALLGLACFTAAAPFSIRSLRGKLRQR